jgi:hypothetical protein
MPDVSAGDATRAKLLLMAGLGHADVTSRAV